MRRLCHPSRAAAAAVWLACSPADVDGQAARPGGNDTCRRLTIESRVLGETRVVDVTVPRRYDADSSARYPVVVVLDGEFEGDVAAAIARFYTASGMIPGVIVVAVHNTARTRDLTPAPVPPFTPPPEPSGGADRFLDFLANEAL